MELKYLSVISKYVVSIGNLAWWNGGVLRGGTQQALASHLALKILIEIKKSISRVGIKSTTSHAHSHTLVPVRHN